MRANLTPVAAAVLLALASLTATAGDFNGDGQSDVLWRNHNTGANAIWRSASTPPRRG